MSLSRFEEDLLRAAPQDGPTADQRRANRAFVMGAAGLVAAAGASAATAGAVHGGAAAATKGIGLAKLAVVIALALGGAAAVFALTRQGSDTPSASPAPPVPALSASSAPVVVAAVTENAPPPMPSAVEIPTASASAAVAVAAPTPARSSAPDPLALETSLLEAARACVNAHDLACASAKLSAYDARFPHGALAEEASLLHIDVARARGDTATARRLAEQLLASHPTGSYARRARAILAELDGK